VKPDDTPLDRAAAMERMLARQQRITSLLVGAYEKDVLKTLADAEASDRPLSRSQLAQLDKIGNSVLAMERKAWCVPDKIETKDTTPTLSERIRNEQRRCSGTVDSLQWLQCRPWRCSRPFHRQKWR
jgi:hypothetical protein